MKNKQLLFLFLTLSLFLFSCKKDGDDRRNQFTLNGETYTLTQGFLTSFGDNGNGSYDYDISLLSTSGSIDIVNEEITGIGNGLYFDLNTNSAGGITSGTYTFSSEREAFSMVATEAFVDYNFDTENGQEVSGVGGTVEINADGDQVSMDFEVVLQDGSTLKGTFDDKLIRTN